MKKNLNNGFGIMVVRVNPKEIGLPKRVGYYNNTLYDLPISDVSDVKLISRRVDVYNEDALIDASDEDITIVEGEFVFEVNDKIYKFIGRFGTHGVEFTLFRDNEDMTNYIEPDAFSLGDLDPEVDLGLEEVMIDLAARDE
jgi:hypothetical protein